MPPSADNIATFVEVVRRQSLSSAARKLGLPKSTVSRRLMRLEQECDVKLLHRDARKITLTPAGRRFFDAVSGAVDGSTAAVAALEQSSKDAAWQPSASLRRPTWGGWCLRRSSLRFWNATPRSRWTWCFTNRLVDLVQEGFDLAVRAGNAWRRATLIARKLCESELQLARASDRSGAFQDDDIRSLERQPFVLHRAERYTQTISLQRQRDKRSKSVELHVHGRLNVDDYAALAELVAAGHGIGVLPAVHVRDGVQASGSCASTRSGRSKHSRSISRTPPANSPSARGCSASG